MPQQCRADLQLKTGVLNGSQLEVIQLDNDKNIENILIHNTTDKNKARLLAGMTYNVDLPTPIGVIYEEYLLMK